MQDNRKSEHESANWQDIFVACWRAEQQLHQRQLDRIFKESDARVARLKAEIEQAGREQ